MNAKKKTKQKKLSGKALVIKIIENVIKELDLNARYSDDDIQDAIEFITTDTGYKADLKKIRILEIK